MKLQHRLGGLEGLDAVPLAYEKRVFVQPWEQRIFGIHTAMMGLSDSLRASLPDYDLDAVPTTFRTTWTWADLRKGAEAMNPFDYFRFRYYEKWLGGITAYFVQQGYITEAELADAIERGVDPAAVGPPEGVEAIDEQVLRYLRDGDSPRRAPATPRFAVGDIVTVADPPATEHTRLPGYLRAKRGVVERVFEGNYTYFCSTGPDGIGEQAMPIYIVGFDPHEVWGESMEAGAEHLYAELYEAYLEPGATDADAAAGAIVEVSA